MTALVSQRIARGLRSAIRSTLLWIQAWLACGLEAAVQLALFWH